MAKKFRLTTMADDFAAIGLVESQGVSVTDEDTTTLAEAFKVKRMRKKTGAAKRQALKAKRARRSKKSQLRRAAKLYARKPRSKKLAQKRAIFKKRRGIEVGAKKRVQMSGMDRVANLIEDVQDILSQVGGRQDQEVVRGFANLALIADSLKEAFQAFGEELDEADLLELSQEFAEIAEDYADFAEAVAAGEEDVDDELIEMFQEDLEDVMQGLELYDDMVEDDEDDDEDDDD